VSHVIDILDRIVQTLDAIRRKLESPEAKAFLKSKGVTHPSQLTSEQRQEFYRFLQEGYLRRVK